MGMKLKLCRPVHSISLIHKLCVFVAVDHVISLLWQLKVSIDYKPLFHLNSTIIFSMKETFLKCRISLLDIQKRKRRSHGKMQKR